MKAYLILSDGTVFEGESFGACTNVIGETVFNTGMTGYQEVLTDPSYYGQIVCMTYPIQGNYGINEDDFESRKSFVKGFIVRNWCDTPSNWRSKMSLDDYLKSAGIPGIYGIDTRHLTTIIREKGVMNGAIVFENNPDFEKYTNLAKEYKIVNAVDSVTVQSPEVFPVENSKFKVALIDYGCKNNIIRSLNKRNCTVHVLPARTSVEEITSGEYDGIMLSNGPGDPEENTEIIQNLRDIFKTGIPVFGICLGHQLSALAVGGATDKLKYGHRGANHPVKDLKADRTYITSQNHGYAVLPNSIPESIGEISHINLNDNTVEGVRYKNMPVFTVQFHPEASPGPADTAYLFDDFIKLMKEVKN